jgi:hypothetical protein
MLDLPASSIVSAVPALGSSGASSVGDGGPPHPVSAAKETTTTQSRRWKERLVGLLVLKLLRSG